MAACVAVISNSNNLLYLRTAECPDPLFYHFKVHAALDVIEDKLSKHSNPNENNEKSEQYLGLLYPMEDHRLYGYVTNTNIKFVMIFESHSQQTQLRQTNSTTQQPHDMEIRNLFQKLHSAYVELVCSPFYKPNTIIDPDKLPASSHFDKCVETMLAKSANSGYCSTLVNLIEDYKISQSN